MKLDFDITDYTEIRTGRKVVWCHQWTNKLRVVSINQITRWRYRCSYRKVNNRKSYCEMLEDPTDCVVRVANVYVSKAKTIPSTLHAARDNTRTSNRTLTFKNTYLSACASTLPIRYWLLFNIWIDYYLIFGLLFISVTRFLRVTIILKTMLIIIETSILTISKFVE